MQDKREKFVKLAEARVNRAIKSIRLIRNLSNRSVYHYGEEDIRLIFAALQEEVNAAKGRFAKGSDAVDEGFKLR